jgi:hypothetical protein
VLEEAQLVAIHLIQYTRTATAQVALATNVRVVVLDPLALLEIVPVLKNLFKLKM